MRLILVLEGIGNLVLVSYIRHFRGWSRLPRGRESLSMNEKMTVTEKMIGWGATTRRH